jgi:hypothetical protein
MTGPDGHEPTVRRGPTGWTIWIAALVVALGAGVATAHGLYEVARASGAPEPIAWLYPLITDGLALVAYASTARLSSSGRRYAWTVVVLAAGLSGLAQASYLVAGVAAAPAEVRFGVGAWPAIAAAIVAHLLYLIGSARTATTVHADSAERVQVDQESVQPEAGRLTHVDHDGVQLERATGVQVDHRSTVQVDHRGPNGSTRVHGGPATVGRAGSPKQRALSAARHHRSTERRLPTVSELESIAGVSRGTAAAALQMLRQRPDDRHAVADDTESSIDQ